ncbi:MAG TPA: TIGR02281 family clan AA aspartic protease [Sphingomonas sp.]|nr:TIGR02281 family clan AA aspartic protease [Sphingomonas sp.]
MKVALLAVVIVGIAAGLAIPTARPVAVAPASAAPADTPVATVIDRAASGHFLAVADVNEEPIRFVVDTGADIVALTQEDARRAHVDFDPLAFDVIGHGASGEVRGQEVRIESIVLDGKRASNVHGVVLEGGEVSLLGQSYLRHIANVQIQGDTMTLR